MWKVCKWYGKILLTKVAKLSLETFVRRIFQYLQHRYHITLLRFYDRYEMEGTKWSFWVIRNFVDPFLACNIIFYRLLNSHSEKYRFKWVGFMKKLKNGLKWSKKGKKPVFSGQLKWNHKFTMLIWDIHGPNTPENHFHVKYMVFTLIWVHSLILLNLFEFLDTRRISGVIGQAKSIFLNFRVSVSIVNTIFCVLGAIKDFLVFLTLDSDSPQFRLYLGDIFRFLWDSLDFSHICTQMLPLSWTLS